MYCRPLVTSGRVYIGLSPLYHVNKGKKNWTYFITKSDFHAYVMEQFVKLHTVSSMLTKKKLSKSQIQSIIRTDEVYQDMLDTIADNYAIYPVLLEDIMIARNFKFPKFKKFIEGKYRCLKVYQQHGTTIVEGLAGPEEKKQTVILSQQLSDACAPLYPYIDESDKRYILDGKKIGLYELVRTFIESEPKNIDRAKGLGTMDARELAISTLDPKNRKLIRYTVDDIEKEIKDMRRVNDDEFELIKAVDISQYEF